MSEIDPELERLRWGELARAIEKDAPEQDQLNLAVRSASAVPFLADEVDRLITALNRIYELAELHKDYARDIDYWRWVAIQDAAASSVRAAKTGLTEGDSGE